jgi:hypothetical protein
VLANALQRSDGSWPAAAIQDSVAAIVRQPAYQRSLRASLFDRLLDWLADGIRRLFAAVPDVPNAKWIILGIAVLLLAGIAARFVFGSEAEQRRRHVRSGTVLGGADPLVEADRLAAAGEFTEAAHLLYRGVTERLAAAGMIRLHPSKTSGDYARQLRAGGSPVHGEFRQFGRRYDRVLFDVGTCDGATYAMLREQAARLGRPEARAA